jgi:aspartate oxidase
MDFTKNPKGLNTDFSSLSEEARAYLGNSDALFGTPIERLEKMNPAAIELYASHGIDLYKNPLRIAVCAQHCNGGVCVDENWESTVKGLYAAGEAAGTFGVYRPGGSALNSTQVGSLRAAEHIARKERKAAKDPHLSLPKIDGEKPSPREALIELRQKMSRFASFDRSTERMEVLFGEICEKCENFFDIFGMRETAETALFFKAYDAFLTARSTLSAMLCSAKEIGTHGAAIVDRKPCTSGDAPRKSRTLTMGADSRVKAVSPLPDPPLWFETLLKKRLAEEKEREGRK